MADSNVPEHTDRGLFGLFGKKDGEKKEEHVQQQSHSADPYATHAPAYTGGVQHAPPSAVSHEPQQLGEGEGGKKEHGGLMGKLHRSNSSSSSSSSDEEESGGKKKEGRKKKGKKGEKASKEDPPKKGLVEKIKEKLPGHKEGEREH